MASASLPIEGFTASVLLVLLSAVPACRAANFCGAFSEAPAQCRTRQTPNELGVLEPVICFCTSLEIADPVSGLLFQMSCDSGGDVLEALSITSSCDLSKNYYMSAETACTSGCVDTSAPITGSLGNVFCDANSASNAGVCGDPHFYGFDSSDWDFQGEVNATYSLISSTDTQVNSRFVLRDRRYDPVRGWYQLNQFKEVSTWIGGIGIRHKNDVVVVEKLEDMSVVVQANGHDVPFDTPVQLRDGVVVHLKNVSYEPGERRTQLLNGFKADEGYTTLSVIITLPSLVVQAEIPPTFSCRMDLSMALKAPMAKLAGQFEGMLGRTIRNVTAEHPVITMEEEYPDTTWVIDIDEQREKLRYSATLEEVMISAYETTGLLEYDSATNRFNPTASDGGPTGLPFTELPSSARRAMMEELNLFSGQNLFAGVVFR